MKYLKTLAILLVAGMVLAGPVMTGVQPSAAAEEKYLGTDDLVDRKMQEIAGVSAGEPLFDLEQGNLGMFVFVAGGFAAGTVFGYYWRKIFGEKAGKRG